MPATSDSAAEPAGPTEDNTFALHALQAYSVSVLLVISLGSKLQRDNLNLGLLVTEIVFIALPASVVLLVHRKTVAGTLFSVPRSGQIALSVVIGGCAAVVAVYKGIATRKALAGVDTSGVDVAGSMSVLLLLLLAPLCEELLFRPVIQNGLARHWSNRMAVVLAAVLFGLFHLSVSRFAETFVIGLFAGIVFLKTRNFWCPVVVHFLCNALGLVLWRRAAHLAFLLNPTMVIALACAAIAGCYYLGGRSPAPLKGLRQRLNWAVFGTPHTLQLTQVKSRRVALLTWGLIVCLAILIGYGHSVMMRQSGKRQFDTGYVVSERDEWTVVSSGEIRARSTLVIRRSPETYEDLIVQLPLQEATVQKVTLGDGDLPFSPAEDGKYRIDLLSRQNATRSSPVIVQWTFSPAECLSRDEMGRYWAPLRSLAPSDSFSLTVSIADGSDLQFWPDDRVRTKRAFRGSFGRPALDYGTWPGLIDRKDE